MTFLIMGIVFIIAGIIYWRVLGSKNRAIRGMMWTLFLIIIPITLFLVGFIFTMLGLAELINFRRKVWSFMFRSFNCVVYCRYLWNLLW